MTKKSIRERAIMLFLLSLVLVFGGYLVLYPESFRLTSLCEHANFLGEDPKCSPKFGGQLVEAIVWALPFISIPFLLLTIVPRTYGFWRRFARWALSIILILTVATAYSNHELLFWTLSASEIASVLSQFYAILSGLLIFYSWQYEVGLVPEAEEVEGEAV